VEKSKTIFTWRDLQDLYESLSAQPDRQWLFRGQRVYGWELESSLERACKRYRHRLKDMPDWECWLISEFKRHAHRYLEHLPVDNDILRWLALMQHHGAPTRLLDFSYSFYDGVFFAIECVNPGDHCALWVVDGKWCWKRAKKQKQLPAPLVARIDKDLTRGKTPKLQAEILKQRKPLVIPDNSFFLDERLAVQQGVFLVPLDLTKPFMENLRADQNEGEGHICKYEICCTLKFFKDAQSQLRRMNITRGSLFPDLDGFAHGLRTRMASSDPRSILGAAEHGI
jgi:hypothetical protein